MEYTLLIVYLLIAIGFSFLCSVAEAVLLSITPSFIAELKNSEDSDNAATKRIIELKQNIDRPLSAILSLNTIAHTVGAAGVGAQAAKIFDDRYVGVTSGILTLLILVFSEIIPKTLGAMHWRRLASPVSLLIKGLIVLMYPLVWLSEVLTKLMSSDGHQTVVTRAEIRAITELGSQEGLLDERESGALLNLLQLDVMKVEDIMTPRPVVIAMDQTKRLGDVIDEVKALPVSRVPLFNERRDAVTGFALRSDLLIAIANDEFDRLLSEFSRAIPAVDEADTLSKTFELLLEQRNHIALVTDQFGGMEGIVTMEDLIETMLSVEIVDEHDTHDDMRKVARREWTKRLQRQGIEVEPSS